MNKDQFKKLEAGLWSATGGLADTVIDAADERHGNGFVFGPATAEALLQAAQRAVAAWRDPVR